MRMCKLNPIGRAALLAALQAPPDPAAQAAAQTALKAAQDALDGAWHDWDQTEEIVVSK